MGFERIAEGEYLVQVRIRVQGRIVTKQSTITGTKEAAKNLLHKLKADLRAGCSLTIAKTFEDVLRFYLARNDKGRSGPLFNRLSVDLGGVKLSELGERFDRWLLSIRNSTGKRTGRPIAAGTVNRYLAWSKAALNFAVKNRLIDRNPILHLEPLKEVARDVSISAEQELRLLNIIEAEAPHLLAAVRFMLQVPCRRSEVVNMRRGDVDLFNNCIRVRNGTTKNDAGIDKPIPPDLVSYMRSIPAESEYVFYRQEGGRYHGLGDFKKAWARVIQEPEAGWNLRGVYVVRDGADMPGLRVHDLRHVSASRMIDAGTPEQVVMTIAGWKTNMLRVYYNRNTKKALELVRFQPRCEGYCEGSKVEAL